MRRTSAAQRRAWDPDWNRSGTNRRSASGWRRPLCRSRWSVSAKAPVDVQVRGLRPRRRPGHRPEPLRWRDPRSNPGRCQDRPRRGPSPRVLRRGRGTRSSTRAFPRPHPSRQLRRWPHAPQRKEQVRRPPATCRSRVCASRRRRRRRSDHAGISPHDPEPGSRPWLNHCGCVSSGALQP